jgi:hypothetical protein
VFTSAWILPACSPSGATDEESLYDYEEFWDDFFNGDEAFEDHCWETAFKALQQRNPQLHHQFAEVM